MRTVQNSEHQSDWIADKETFRVVWRGAHLLLAAVLLSSRYAGVREYAVRRYLDGFSDAIVPNSLPEEQKLEAILNGMRVEPSRTSEIKQ